jgi:hypothetical protein
MSTYLKTQTLENQHHTIHLQRSFAVRFFQRGVLMPANAGSKVPVWKEMFVSALIVGFLKRAEQSRTLVSMDIPH